ncbi:MAG: hypothetical protein O3C43_00555 [Verrucomicrobia bacterium]|nr:hypothetical protein [Verrucomicrobiota bacterium]MDA1064967.1 hypothetical protein [Verrucomicrobiota bacterium]
MGSDVLVTKANGNRHIPDRNRTTHRNPLPLRQRKLTLQRQNPLSIDRKIEEKTEIYPPKGSHGLRGIGKTVIVVAQGKKTEKAKIPKIVGAIQTEITTETAISGTIRSAAIKIKPGIKGITRIQEMKTTGDPQERSPLRKDFSLL